MSYRRWFNSLPFHVRRKAPSPLSEQARILTGTDVRTIFDVGAHIGTVAQQYRATFPEATVYAFEPSPDTFVTLQQETASHGQIKSFPLALSDHVGTATFYRHHSNATDSLLPATAAAQELVHPTYFKSKGEVQVAVTTLDAFTAEHQIQHMDILKMDIQGGELAALRGAEGLLSAQKIGLIFCEVEFVSLYEKQGLYHHLAAYLEDYHYTLLNFYDLNVNKSRGQVLWADVIFLSPALRNGI